MIRFVLVACLVTLVSAQNQCPGGGQIYKRGISRQGKYEVLKAHNDYRDDITAGRVPGQPRGTNLKRMKYDDILGRKGSVVSNSCEMEHKDINDDRWWWVGQNLYISWSSQYGTTENWKDAVKAWFDEHKYFKYPNTSYDVTGHYTQVVWADSDTLGCDFIAYYDVHQPRYPYAKLYTCNYGPGGNIQDWNTQAMNPPYQV